MMIRNFNKNLESEAYDKLYITRQKSYPNSKLPASKKELLKFQTEVLENTVEYLNKYKYCILNLDTGLGKTFLSLHLITQCYKSENNKIPILIVAPANNIIDPWEKEINELNHFKVGSLKVYKYHGLEKETLSDNNSLQVIGYDVILTSYQTLVSKNCNSFFRETCFPLVIFDEPQKIINQLKANISLKSLSFIKSSYRLALTASPLSNSPNELYILEAFIENPASIWRAYSFIKDENDSVKESCRKFIPIISESKFSSKVQDDISLPNLNQYRFLLPVSDSVEEKLKEINNFPQKSKLLACPTLFRVKNDELFFDSKIKILKLILEKIPRYEKTIIFSMYTEGLEYLFCELTRMGYICFKTIGQMTTKARADSVTDFKTYKKKAVMLASIKANETGLNYQEANNVIFLDTWYNPQVIKQARDRCFRLGQKKTVQVFFLSTNTDFENQVWKTENQKIKEKNELLHWEMEPPPQELDYSDNPKYIENIGILLDNIYKDEVITD